MLRKQAELSSNSSAADTLSDARNFRQFSATSSLPSAQRPYPSSSSAFSPSSLAAKSSISLKYIRLNSHVFSLERWSSPAEFDNLVPAHFRIPAHANPEGVDLLESLLHDMGAASIEQLEIKYITRIVCFQGLSTRCCTSMRCWAT